MNPPDMTLTGKNVVVTGASQGLGLAVSRKLVDAGAVVVGLSSDKERLDNEFAAFGSERVATYECDIRYNDDVKSVVQQIIETHGRVDILINNAGVWTDNELDASEPDRRQLAFDTNALGPIQVTEAFLPKLKEQEKAHIFNVISTSGDATTPAGDNSDWKTYGATKWAFTGYTNTLRNSLQHTGVKVTGFFPGGIDTNLYENANRPDPHGQFWMMDVDDVADIVLFMLSRPDDVLIESLTVTKAY